MFKISAIAILILISAIANADADNSVSANPKASYTKEDSTVVGSQVEFVYHPESLYEVNCQIGHITDITLKPGEEIIYIGAGDTAQWMVDQSVVNNTSHIYIKPKVSDATTNVIINSNFHSYRLLLTSTDNYYPIVKWSFDVEEQKARNKLLGKSDAISSSSSFIDKDGVVSERKKLNFNYRLTKKKNVSDVYLPISVYDDGLKTYIKMQANNKYDLPVLYNVDKKNNLTLVNYRIRGNLYVVDRVFEHAKLIFTNKSYIDFVASKGKDN